MTSCLPPILKIISLNLSWSLPGFIFCFPVLISMPVNMATLWPTISGVISTLVQPIKSGIPSSIPWKGRAFFIIKNFPFHVDSPVQPSPQLARKSLSFGFKLLSRSFITSRSFCPMRIMSHRSRRISSIFYGGCYGVYCNRFANR